MITVLGILFVTGVAFMASMNFEAEQVAIERESGKEAQAAQIASELVTSLLADSFRPPMKITARTGVLGEMVDVPDPVGAGFMPVYRPWRPSWVELPRVRGLVSQIEPEPIDPLNPSGSRRYRYTSELRLLKNGPTYEDALATERSVPTSQRRGLRNSGGNMPLWSLGAVGSLNFVAHPDPPSVADADGDGIVDCFLTDAAQLGFGPAQIAALAPMLNGPDNPTNRVLMGLRVIPHGGMVNLSDGHPLLIGNIMRPEFPVAMSAEQRHDPYTPEIEEPSLRRRGMLPPRLLPPTAVQGDPLNTEIPGWPGRGDFGLHLFGNFGGLNPATPESILEGDHRYWPFEYDPDPGGSLVDFSQWLNRMNPTTTTGGYDRRHLVTTLSHDDLLSRPTPVVFPDNDPNNPPVIAEDALSLMRRANRPDPADPSLCGMAFEFVNYPQDIANINRADGDPKTWCDCTDPTSGASCTPDPRKGKLRLSIPWLDHALRTGAITSAQRLRLVQDAFSLMLLNSRSPEWGSYDAQGNWKWHEPNLLSLSWAAASLTANLIDFADETDIPTPVPVRSLDFLGAGFNGVHVPPGEPLSTAIPGVDYVFGLERQLYITEIAAAVVEDSSGDPIADKSAWAVELFNPHDIALPTAINNRYGLFLQVDQGLGANPVELPLTFVGAQQFYVVGNSGGNAPAELRDAIDESIEISFEPGNVIYLLMKVGVNVYGSTIGERFIVLDQVTVPADFEAKTDDGGQNNIDAEPKSLARPGVTESTPWFAPVPADPAFDVQQVDGITLGEDNPLPVNPNLKPVQVVLANNGPPILATDPNSHEFHPAFPTTGSLLLLMRHANHDIDGRGFLMNEQDYAFTRQLAKDVAGKSLKDLIDNGRMPVFDVNRAFHQDPNVNRTFDELRLAPGEPVDPSTINRPGEWYHLPWGQFVFDYFTALPLSHPSPYANSLSAGEVDYTAPPSPPQRDPATNHPLYGLNRNGSLGYIPFDGERPRVDQQGLRVHGRIDINAAPWTVLSGVPLIPMVEIPESFRAEIKNGAGLGGTTDDSIAFPLGLDRAQAIVAYREMRELSGATGDYATERGWTIPDVAVRRGTGFLTVGELANVRHSGAAAPFYLVDGGVVLDDSTGHGNFIQAIAPLVALSDWVTTRSHVFTMYGVLRGELGETGDLADLDARAIRFQETIDRLPTVLESRAPVRIGPRTVGRYLDVQGD